MYHYAGQQNIKTTSGKEIHFFTALDIFHYVFHNVTPVLRIQTQQNQAQILIHSLE
jgi:hypothetical protein